MTKPDEFSLDQIKASNPAENIWVQANAGTGKTKVLVHRLMRILFRNKQYGETDASGILCLTYTNAAAGEMRNRILEGLRNWATADDELLSKLLETVTENNPPTQKDLSFARKVFFSYIDNPDMLKIKTIHSFCEEILHRFPLEAGISPTWSLVSGAAQSVLLDDAFNRMITNSFKGLSNVQNTMDAFRRIVDIKSEYFLSVLQELLLGRYRSFFQVDNVDKYREYFIDTTRKILGIEQTINIDIKPDYLTDIINIADNLKKSSKKPAGYLSDFVNYTQQYIDNTIDFEKYKDLYLTDKNELLSPKKRAILKEEPFCTEAERVYKIKQYLLNQEAFKNTVALFDLAKDFADTYRALKQERNLLDFEDLILYTQKLFLKPDVMGWVLSQMDVSLSHILVDEAQDTSPQQWNILRALAGDFFTEGNDKNNRSIFVVGDTKQSIYGFQNADPYAFADSRLAIEEQIKNNYRTIQEVSLDQSFRSLKPILQTVDCFFDCPEIIQQTGFINNKHKYARQNTDGIVEINKAFDCEETGLNKNKLYIDIVADKIEKLVKQENINPGDVLVLVQRRDPFAGLLSVALKKKGVDVAGNDRIKLPEFSAIKDLLHLVRFCIDNTNDYSLCCVLKSPFYRLKERDIFNLCKIKNDAKNAGKTVSVADVLSNEMPDVYNDIMDFNEKSKTLAPYSFFTYVFNKNDNRKKFISALGKQIIDPLEEFFSMCLAYERTQSGTLYHFLKWFVTGDSEIKRDMDADSGVRIMTVHGSKGLGAKVVFLIDTFVYPKADTILNTNYLYQDTDYDLWLWNTSKSATIQKIIDKNKQDSFAEYYRLLYVAMTRACDRLYIYGCDTERVPELVWHKQLWKVFSQLSNDDTIRITHDTDFTRFFDWCKE
ncbi:MAG: UvrD-helicase domain-containing protein [Alphaproteobacteria bacterium]|nr:UvrD-helicase domain-containing protein [Alphaproteobacteria bacterium]